MRKSSSNDHGLLRARRRPKIALAHVAGSWPQTRPLRDYVQPYPGPGARTIVSTDGGREPVWSRDGGELFYRSGDRMMVESEERPSELHIVLNWLDELEARVPGAR